MDHDDGQIQLRQVRRHHLGQGLGSPGNEPSRDRRLARALRGLAGLLADRLEAEPVAARGQLAQHPLQRQLLRQIRRRERLIRRHRNLRRAVGGTDPRPPHSNLAPPRTTDPASLLCRTAVRSGSCLPFGPHSAVTPSSITAAITCSPALTAGPAAPPGHPGDLGTATQVPRGPGQPSGGPARHTSPTPPAAIRFSSR
jgi:hypothetical protein